MKRILALTYGMLAYTFFLGTFLYAVLFVGNVWVSKTIDRGSEAQLATAKSIAIAVASWASDPLSIVLLTHTLPTKRTAYRKVPRKNVYASIPYVSARIRFILYSTLFSCEPPPLSQSKHRIW